MSLTDTLKALRDTLSIQPSSSQTLQIGVPFKASIAPTIDGIQVTDTLDVPIAFDLIAKEMVFSNANIADSTVLQPVPFVDVTTVPPSTRPGVPGFLGRLSGSLPVPIQVPIRLEVEWSVRDMADNPLAEASAFMTPSGLTASAVEILFLPAFVELTDTSPIAPWVPRKLHARVRLSGGGVTTGWRDVPDLTLQVPGIALPLVLVSFLNTNFTGAALVMVPANSWVSGIGALQNVLNEVYNRLSPLSAVATFAAFLAGLEALTKAMAQEPRLVFEKRDSIANLNDIDLIKRGFLSNDTEAEDELSSMILVGPTGRGVECFNDRNFKSGEGKFTLVARAYLHALVLSLHAKSPTSGPTGDEITIDNEPPGGWFSAASFGDELSSIRFTGQVR